MKINSIHGPVRLLIVDDDAVFRSCLHRNLYRIWNRMEGSSASIDEADSGLEAIRCIRKANYHCVLLDYRMPGASGISCLREIMEIRKDVAVIMLTGLDSASLAVEAMKNGAVDYLIKGSYTPEELERAVVNAIERVRLQSIVRTQQASLLEAERQRVMLESLGLACHQIGQPATILKEYLGLVHQRVTDAGLKDMLASCIAASDKINEVLRQLQQVSHYRTAPYIVQDGEDQVLCVELDETDGL